MIHSRIISEYKNHHVDVSGGTDIYTVSKYNWTDYLWITKGKNGTFTVKKSGGHQVIKVNITNNGINWHHMPPEVMHWGHNITYVLFLPKMHNLKLVMRKQSEKSKTVGQSKKQLTYNLQKPSICQKINTRWGTWISDPGLDLGSENKLLRGHRCYTGQVIYEYGLYNSIMLMLN